MAGDIALLELESGIDLIVDKGDLISDDGLRTAVLISLFTDRRVSAEELPPGETNRRGWWADSIAEEPGDQIGSKLWLLEREKQTSEVLERAREYAEEALQWMIEDSVAASVSVATSYPARGILRIEVEITRPNKETASLAYDYAWEREAQNAG